MKIRNKKTGDIYEIPALRHPTCQMDDIAFFACKDGVGTLFTYNRVADIADEWEDWEDYTPKEPLIKDEKIRKAVRAWAEVNGIRQVGYVESLNRDYCCLTDIEVEGDGCRTGYCIKFVGWIPTLKDCGEYAIDELCGEEEK